MLHITVYDDSDSSVSTFTCADDEYQLLLGSGFAEEAKATWLDDETIQLTIKKGA